MTEVRSRHISLHHHNAHKPSGSRWLTLQFAARSLSTAKIPRCVISIWFLLFLVHIAQYLVEAVIRTRIYDSMYWKEHCFALTGAIISV